MTRKVTIKDIARLAGVSIGSVSTVFSKKNTNVHLSPETRKKILKIAEQYNYKPNVAARAIQANKSYLLGFFYTTNNWYLQNRLLRGIRQVCSLRDYDIIVYPSDNLAEETYNLQTSHVTHLDGIITIPVLENDQTNQTAYEALANRGIPVVQVLVDFWKQIPVFTRDYIKVGYEAVRALYEYGHRDIGLIVFDNYPNPTHAPGSWGIVKGSQMAAADFGVTVRLCPVNSKYEREMYSKSSEEVTSALLETADCPTALIATSCYLAYGAYSAMLKHDISIPGDMSLITCGDDAEPFGQFVPNLAKFPTALEELGRMSAEYCLSEPEDRSVLRQLVYSDLIPGDTLGPAPVKIKKQILSRNKK
ncbi:MAG: LacI family DNA-binding transcriptional regulator [Lentisphaeria bacterium]|nr:LacI family DNA-binding transcriptional regulator [Lentisphaeria bacterium]